MALILKNSKASRIISGLYIALQLKQHPIFETVVLKEEKDIFDLSCVLGHFGHQY